MSKKKFIFFDAAGTLFDVERGVGFHYRRIAEKFGATPPTGVQLTSAFLDEQFHETFKKAPPLAFPGLSPTGLKKAEKEWWRNRVGEVFQGFSFPSFDSFFEELYHFFQEGGNDRKDGAAWTLFPETREVLEQLSGSGYPLGIISNFDSRIYILLKSLGIFHFFRTFTVSGEEGVAKPSREIFIRALKKAECRPSEALFIGDHPQYDIEGAESAGIFSLLIDRKGEDQGANAIRNLKEVYRYL